MNIAWLRNEVVKIINENPTDITIKRDILSSDDMDGFIKNGEETISLVIRLYNKNYSNTIVNDSGVEYNSKLKAICQHDSDIRVNDIFIVDNETLKVKDIKLNKLQSEIISKEIILERVK